MTVLHLAVPIFILVQFGVALIGIVAAMLYFGGEY